VCTNLLIGANWRLKGVRLGGRVMTPHRAPRDEVQIKKGTRPSRRELDARNGSWSIVSVFDTNLVIELRYANGRSFYRCLHYTTDRNDIWWNYLEETNQFYYPELRGIEVSARNVFDLPMSREVTLRKGRTEIKVIVRSDCFRMLFELLENYHKGLRLVSREEKYKNFYQVYEELSAATDPELKAIRHSLSHSRRKLTSKGTTAALFSMFGDVKVDLRIYQHAQIFKRKLAQLREESEKLLVIEILKILPEKPNFLGVFYTP
jgi:hypothetical protein